jgi:hypothetical protein
MAIQYLLHCKQPFIVLVTRAKNACHAWIITTFSTSKLDAPPKTGQSLRWTLPIIPKASNE